MPRAYVIGVSVLGSIIMAIATSIPGPISSSNLFPNSSAAAVYASCSLGPSAVPCSVF